MKICPKCHKIYEDSQNFCSEDGTPLELTPASRKMREEAENNAAPAPVEKKEAEPQETVTEVTPVHVQQEEQKEDAATQNPGYTEFKVEEDNGQQANHNEWQKSYTQSKNFDEYFKENIPNSQNWKAMYLNMDGRLTKVQFRCRWLLVILAGFFISLVCAVLPPLGAIGSLALLVLGIMNLTLGGRRLHDTNHSAWWMILTFVPMANLGLLLYLLFKDSYPGDNPYGPMVR